MKFHGIGLCKSLILIVVSFRKWERQRYRDRNGQRLQIPVFVDYRLTIVIRPYSFIIRNLKFESIGSEKAA